MPAFGNSLSSSEVDDLTAYLALMQYRYSKPLPVNTPVGGEALARKFSCFTCHGELGQGGVENPRSLKGYTPGFYGTDFRALTRNGNRQDIREWILDGRSEYFWNQGFAGFYLGRFFTGRQEIQMPAYKEMLTDAQVETLVDYLLELMELGPLNAGDIMNYHPLGDAPVGNPPEDRDFTQSAAPLATQGLAILHDHCVECHGPEKQRSRFRLDSRESAIQGGEIADFLGRSAVQPGSAENSLLVEYIEAEEEIPEEEIYPMPPGDRPRLNQEQIEILQKWIDSGFEWPGRG
jgi:mono/diheme cytochrome c family protein